MISLSDDRVPERLRSKQRKRRLLGVLPSVGGHLAVLAAILLVHKPDLPIVPVDDRPVSLSIVPGEKPAPVPRAQTEAPKPKAEPPPRHDLARRAAARPPPQAAPAAKDPRPPQQGAELSAADLAGASSADSGGGGGSCDLARQLQGALRKDPLVQAAVAGQAGKAIRVWDGDWVRSGAEDGKGLAAVREAIIWEIAFAPEACRSRPVHGLVLLSMNSGSGAARLALGAGEWRWADLLHSRQ